MEAPSSLFYRTSRLHQVQDTLDPGTGYLPLLSGELSVSFYSGLLEMLLNRISQPAPIKRLLTDCFDVKVSSELRCSIRKVLQRWQNTKQLGRV